MAAINLLLVDDEERFLHTTKTLLEKRDFRVTAVSSGAEALEVARNHRIDIALVDLKMPGLNGEETLKALKNEHKWMEVVILTGHGSVDSAVECTKKGAYFYLQKPCGLEKLLSVLVEAYKKRIRNKREIEEDRLDEILKVASSESPLEILRRIKELDREQE